MQKLWIPLTSISSFINNINGATIGKTATDFVADMGTPDDVYIEYGDDPDVYPNLIITSSATPPLNCIVDGNLVMAELLGGSHSPRRPK